MSRKSNIHLFIIFIFFTRFFFILLLFLSLNVCILNLLWFIIIFYYLSFLNLLAFSWFSLICHPMWTFLSHKRSLHGGSEDRPRRTSLCCWIEVWYWGKVEWVCVKIDLCECGVLWVCCMTIMEDKARMGNGKFEKLPYKISLGGGSYQLGRGFIGPPHP